MSRNAKNRMYEGKAQLHSVQMQLQNQIGEHIVLQYRIYHHYYCLWYSTIVQLTLGQNPGSDVAQGRLLRGWGGGVGGPAPRSCELASIRRTLASRRGLADPNANALDKAYNTCVLRSIYQPLVSIAEEACRVT